MRETQRSARRSAKSASPMREARRDGAFVAAITTASNAAHARYPQQRRARRPSSANAIQFIVFSENEERSRDRSHGGCACVRLRAGGSRPSCCDACDVCLRMSAHPSANRRDLCAHGDDASAGNKKNCAKSRRQTREWRRRGRRRHRILRIALTPESLGMREIAGLRCPDGSSAARSPPADWLCRPSSSSLDRRTSRAWSASPWLARPCRDWRR